MMLLKKLIGTPIGAILLLASVAWCQVTITPDDPNIQYFGRVNFSNPQKPVFDWEGVYFKAVFEGTSCGVKFEDQGTNYFDIFIDGALWANTGPIAGNVTYTGVQGLSNSTHTILVSRRSETNNGTGTAFAGFVLDSGSSLAIPPARPIRRMEFVGDSITAGYGAEAVSTEAYTNAKTNAYLTYAALTARNFNAEYSLIARSGRGMIRNNGELGPVSAQPMPSYYEQTQVRVSSNNWDFAASQADAVLITLGTNDFSGNSSYWPDKTTFETAYIQFVQKVRVKYPAAHIFCTSFSTMKSTCTLYIEEVANLFISSGDARVHYASMEYTLISPDDIGSGHPNASGHIKMANALIPIVAAATGWSSGVDTSSPSAVAAVRDGAGADVDYVQATTFSTQLSANWDSSVDAESGIAKYWYGIGTAPGSINILAWADNGTSTAATKTGLTLSAGTTYYFSVKAENGSGLQSPATNSNGQYYAAPASTTTPVVPPVTPSTATIKAEIRAYPNPSNDISAANPVRFRAGGSIIKEAGIYTVSGRLIRTLSGTGAEVSELVWDGKNAYGQKVGRG
ncbi:MAG: hypothetical protein A2297_03680, partial [Elusimicrobia bacterium RIFOXYB2_FULL_48_7]